MATKVRMTSIFSWFEPKILNSKLPFSDQPGRVIGGLLCRVRIFRRRQLLWNGCETTMR